MSSSEEVFNKSNKIYSKESGFKDDLKYSPSKAQQLENNEGMKRK